MHISIFKSLRSLVLEQRHLFKFIYKLGQIKVWCILSL